MISLRPGAAAPRAALKAAASAGVSATPASLDVGAEAVALRDGAIEARPPF